MMVMGCSVIVTGSGCYSGTTLSLFRHKTEMAVTIFLTLPDPLRRAYGLDFDDESILLHEEGIHPENDDESHWSTCNIDPRTFDTVLLLWTFRY